MVLPVLDASNGTETLALALALAVIAINAFNGAATIAAARVGTA